MPPVDYTLALDLEKAKEVRGRCRSCNARLVALRFTQGPIPLIHACPHCLTALHQIPTRIPASLPPKDNPK